MLVKILSCYLAKKVKSHSRRRPLSGVTVHLKEGEEPFGACVHMDFIVMDRNSAASKSAREALLATDEKTRFLGAFPGNDRTAEAIVDNVHQYEGPDLKIRRWWTDSAPEFKKASRIIRSQRPLAHYTSIPYRHQSNGIAERSNRLVEEGTRTILVASGFNGTWWVLAMVFW